MVANSSPLRITHLLSLEENLKLYTRRLGRLLLKSGTLSKIGRSTCSLQRSKKAKGRIKCEVSLFIAMVVFGTDPGRKGVKSELKLRGTGDGGSEVGRGRLAPDL
eukprot:Rmarinus@m.26576